MSGWLIAILVILDAFLISFHNSEIVKSWLCVYWPGSGREINWPASLFWSALLVWLALSVYRVLRGAEASNLRRAVVVWSLLGILAAKYFFLPWCEVVGNHAVSVILLLAIPTCLIFCCSSSEAALLQPGALSPSTQSIEPSKRWLVRSFKSRVRKGYSEVAGNCELANGMIVLVNTILAIGMTVGIQNTLAKNPTKSPSADAFTVYGVTVLLFLFGEMLPKQMALSKNEKWKDRAVRIGRRGIAFLYVTFLVHFVACGIVDTFQLAFSKKKT